MPVGSTSHAATVEPSFGNADAHGAAEDVLVTLRAARQAAKRTLDRSLDLKNAKLIGEDLAGVDFRGSDLSGADLSRANLSGANLSRCCLRGATLHQTVLEGAELLGADLSDANLDECDARQTGFGGVDLSRATLLRSNLTGATLIRTTARGTDFTAATLRGARLRDSDLREARFIQTDLAESDLENTKVDACSFDGSDLRSAAVRKIHGYDEASWIGVDIRDVNFSSAYLMRRFILDENYLHEFRTRDRVSEILYRVWWITSDCGRSFTRWAMWTVFIAILFAGLFTFVDIDYGDYRTSVSPIYYSVVTLTTLGYGDVLPASAAAQMLVVAQVIIGYIALGGLLSIFANKMGRRAD